MGHLHPLSRRPAARPLAVIVVIGGWALLAGAGLPVAAGDAPAATGVNPAPDRAVASRRAFAPLVAASPPSRELLVFDWNGPITIDHHGIPAVEPLPGGNGDWTQPVNYAQGTIYLRLEVRSQPQPQRMRLQVCWSQPGRETCTRAGRVTGTPGAVTTWSQPVACLWSHDSGGVDWAQPRHHAIFVRDAANHIISDYGDYNWGGHDPALWFPLNVRFTGVVVEPEGTFSGWEHYVR